MQNDKMGPAIRNSRLGKILQTLQTHSHSCMTQIPTHSPHSATRYSVLLVKSLLPVPLPFALSTRLQNSLRCVFFLPLINLPFAFYISLPPWCLFFSTFPASFLRLFHSPSPELGLGAWAPLQMHLTEARARAEPRLRKTREAREKE